MITKVVVFDSDSLMEQDLFMQGVCDLVEYSLLGLPVYTFWFMRSLKLNVESKNPIISSMSH